MMRQKFKNIDNQSHIFQVLDLHYPSLQFSSKQNHDQASYIQEFSTYQNGETLKSFRNKKRMINKIIRHENLKDKTYRINNFLEFATKPHIQLIIKFEGQEWFANYPILKQLLNRKAYMSMKEFQIIYQVQELRAAWLKFFDQKILYEKLKISKRVKEWNRQIYFQRLDIFEYSFIKQKFEGIQTIEKSQIIKVMLNKKINRQENC